MTEHKDIIGLGLHEAFHYTQSSDPGAVGAYIYWLNTSSAPYVLYRRNSTNSGWIQVGGEGGRVLLETLTPNGVSTITTAVTLSGYQKLEIELKVRSTIASTSDYLNCEFNGDTVNGNYIWSLVQSYGLATDGNMQSGNSRGIFYDSATGANSPANSYGIGKMEIPFYDTSNQQKVGHFDISHNRDNSSVWFVHRRGGFVWGGTDPISSIRFFLTTGNFSNSIIKIYGES